MEKNSAIPQIDLLPLWNDPVNGVEKVANEIKQVFSDIGFAYLYNHQVPAYLIDNIFKTCKDFHALPHEVKMKIKQNNCFRGYMPIGGSQLKVSTQGSASKPNQMEAFIMAFDLPINHPDYKTGAYLAGPNQWPDGLTSFKEVVNDYRDAMLKLAYKLLEVFSVALGGQPQDLNRFFVNPSYFLRLQCYPKRQDDISENQFGIAPHTDYGFFTILAQDNVGGLEIKDNKGEWIKIPYISQTYILNAGDMLKRWSNDKIKSIAHRVINKSHQNRYSVPFFFEPNMRAVIKVLESCVSIDRPAKFPPIIYGEYLLDRVQGNYNLGKRGT